MAQRQRGHYKTAFFFGAGASKALGVPVTSELLPHIVAHLYCGVLFGDRARDGANERARQTLANGLDQLLPGFWDADPPQITDVLSLLDQMIVSQQSIIGVSAGHLSELRRLLERATLWVLANVHDPVPRQVTSDAQVFFRRLIDDGLRRNRRSCIITTNYDRIVEAFTLKDRTSAWIENAVDFGFSWRRHSPEGLVQRPRRPVVGLFKLHGSSNWLACPLCGHVYIRPDKSLYTVAFWSQILPHNSCHCGYGPLRTVIVAPSMVRTIAETSLLAAWQAAFEAMRTADEWVFVGYSLPNEDIAIRSLLLRAYRGRRSQPQVTVITRDCDDGIVTRYSFMFPGCAVRRGGFEKYLATYRESAH